MNIAINLEVRSIESSTYVLRSVILIIFFCLEIYNFQYILKARQEKALEGIQQDRTTTSIIGLDHNVSYKT